MKDEDEDNQYHMVVKWWQNELGEMFSSILIMQAA